MNRGLSMREEALGYYRKDIGCSQSVLMAFEKKYAELPWQLKNACGAMNAGFGIGGMCSVVIAGIMIFGILYDENTAKRLRMKLLDQMADNGLSLLCPLLRKHYGENGCDMLVGEIAGLIDGILDEEGYIGV